MKIKLATLFAASAITAFAQIPWGFTQYQGNLSITLGVLDPNPSLGLPQLPVSLRQYGMTVSIQGGQSDTVQYQVTVVVKLSDGGTATRIQMISRAPDPLFTNAIFMFGSAHVQSVDSVMVIPISSGQIAMFQ